MSRRARKKAPSREGRSAMLIGDGRIAAGALILLARGTMLMTGEEVATDILMLLA